MASKEQEKQVHKCLSTLLRQLYELEAIAGDFNHAHSQELLLTRLQEFSQGLQQFKQLAAAFNTVEMPTALLKFVDEGGHPDDFVRTTFRTAVADNQLAAGRVAALQAMQQQLGAAAAAAFPDEAAVYSEVVAAKQAELQRLEAEQQAAGQPPEQQQQQPRQQGTNAQ